MKSLLSTVSKLSTDVMLWEKEVLLEGINGGGRGGRSIGMSLSKFKWLLKQVQPMLTVGFII